MSDEVSTVNRVQTETEIMEPVGTGDGVGRQTLAQG